MRRSRRRRGEALQHRDVAIAAHVARPGPPGTALLTTSAWRGLQARPAGCGAPECARPARRGRPPAWHRATLTGLPARLRAAQGLFEVIRRRPRSRGFFEAASTSFAVREGRGPGTNAVDKLLGWALMTGRPALADSIVLSSGAGKLRDPAECLAQPASRAWSVSPAAWRVSIESNSG